MTSGFSPIKPEINTRSENTLIFVAIMGFPVRTIFNNFLRQHPVLTGNESSDQNFDIISQICDSKTYDRKFISHQLDVKNLTQTWLWEGNILRFQSPFHNTGISGICAKSQNFQSYRIFLWYPPRKFHWISMVFRWMKNSTQEPSLV